MSPPPILPFSVPVDAEALADLQERLARTRWPDDQPVDDWSQGVPIGWLRDLCDYWADDYDWAARAERLGEFPQFTTEIDGLDIHFLHVRSPHPEATPLIVTHGWPGSIAEFQFVLGPLTDPPAHGGDPADAFHVVCPSIPGYGFSGKPTEAGWGVERIADAWATLMGRLGYDRFLAQGGDWGSMITTMIGIRHPDRCAGIHLNMPLVAPDPATFDSLSPAETAALAGLDHYQKFDSGYSKQQSTRPQTLGYALADSPVGQAAWILEKFWAWTDNAGAPEDAIDRDALLDNVMLYWLTNSGASSARLYWESFRNPPAAVPTVPVGASVFPKEIFRTSRRWAEAHYGDVLIHFNELPAGGHFAAFEQPVAYVDEVRTCFRSLRTARP